MVQTLIYSSFRARSPQTFSCDYNLQALFLFILFESEKLSEKSEVQRSSEESSSSDEEDEESTSSEPDLNSSIVGTDEEEESEGESSSSDDSEFDEIESSSVSTQTNEDIVPTTATLLQMKKEMKKNENIQLSSSSMKTKQPFSDDSFLCRVTCMVVTMLFIFSVITIPLIIIVFLLLPIYSDGIGGELEIFENILVVNLEQGSMREMGKNYGILLRNYLDSTYNVLLEYSSLRNISYEQLVEFSKVNFEKYPLTHRTFLRGVSNGSNIELAKIKVLHAQQSLLELFYGVRSFDSCTFFTIPKERSDYHNTIIGRFYDYPEPWNVISQTIVVTILKQVDTNIVAMIGFPGEFFCATCVNSNGLFIEVNNGPRTISRGDNCLKREALISSLLSISQESNTFQHAERMMKSKIPDITLVVNMVGKSNQNSYEFSSVDASMKTVSIENEGKEYLFVSTNHFLNETWPDGIQINDNRTKESIERRANFTDLLSKKQGKYFSVSEAKELMEVSNDMGGAKRGNTIIQLVYDNRENELHLKSTMHEKRWVILSLDRYKKVI